MRKVMKEEAQNFAMKENLLFQETSAVTAFNVKSAFENLLNGELV